jgi:hypothetical protein
LIKQQDTKVGRKAEEPPTVETKSANRVTTLGTMLRQGLISEQNYKRQVGALFKQLGGDEKAAQIIEQAMGLK